MSRTAVLVVIGIIEIVSSASRKTNGKLVTGLCKLFYKPISYTSAEREIGHSLVACLGTVHLSTSINRRIGRMGITFLNLRYDNR